MSRQGPIGHPPGLMVIAQAQQKQCYNRFRPLRSLSAGVGIEEALEQMQKTSQSIEPSITKTKNGTVAARAAQEEAEEGHARRRLS